MTDPNLRGELGKLVRQLIQEGEEPSDNSIRAILRAHLGVNATERPVVAEELHAWELPNLQLALDQTLAREHWSWRLVGLAGHARHYQGLSLGDLVGGSDWAPETGPPEYVNVPIGPGRTLPCLTAAVLLATCPDGPLALLVQRGQEQGPMMPTSLTVQAIAAADGVAEAYLADLRRAMDELDVYRGQVLTVKVDPRSGSRIEFVERTTMRRDELILPEGVLDRIERHVAGASKHRDVLLSSGRHLSRGLLLWGPPGTGKTHTVRFLTGLLRKATVIILSGSSLGAVAAFAQMARRLAPSLVVLEDVDLVAQERTYGPFGSSPVLFELMNQMDGLDGDADIAFVLTTNRPDALEPALAARPGRIDLAVELPLPDEECRRRLLALYAEGLNLRLDETELETVVALTEGVTASFVKEVLRKATLVAAEAGRTHVTGSDLTSVLNELLTETAALTRVLLGGERPGADDTPHPHAWMTGAFTIGE